MPLTRHLEPVGRLCEHIFLGGSAFAHGIQESAWRPLQADLYARGAEYCAVRVEGSDLAGYAVFSDQPFTAAPLPALAAVFGADGEAARELSGANAAGLLLAAVHGPCSRRAVFSPRWAAIAAGTDEGLTRTRSPLPVGG
jgi:hypothetical protein